jgi:hypothetical protein
MWICGRLLLNLFVMYLLGIVSWDVWNWFSAGHEEQTDQQTSKGCCSRRRELCAAVISKFILGASRSHVIASCAVLSL